MHGWTRHDARANLDASPYFAEVWLRDGTWRWTAYHFGPSGARTKIGEGENCETRGAAQNVIADLIRAHKRKPKERPVFGERPVTNRAG